jgi:hypothetical protein
MKLLGAYGSFFLEVFAFGALECVSSSENNQDTAQVDDNREIDEVAGWTVNRFFTEDALKEMTS